MMVKCSHCGNEQEYSLRNGKIPKRPKTQCKNEECKKWFYISIDQIDDQKNSRIDQKERKNDQITENNDQIIKNMTKKRPKKMEKMCELHRQNAIKGVKYYLSAWKSRYEQNLGKPYRPVVDDYKSMIDTLNFLEGLK